MEIFLRIKQQYNIDIREFSLENVSLMLRVIKKMKEDEKKAAKGIKVFAEEPQSNVYSPETV